MSNKGFQIVAVVLVLLFSLTRTQAQTKPHADDEKTPRFELGGQLYTLGVDTVWEGGVGGRFTYNVNRFFAIDTEANASVAVGDSIAVDGAQVFAGVKVGWRSKRGGIFAKARPGFVTNFTRQTNPAVFNFQRVTKPAFDIGGVLEYYPSHRTVVRFDASDVIIDFGNDLINYGRCPCPHRFGTTNSLRLEVGFAVRF